jgi:hypothetical protein
VFDHFDAVDYSPRDAAAAREKQVLIRYCARGRPVAVFIDASTVANTSAASVAPIGELCPTSGSCRNVVVEVAYQLRRIT